jgi:hypothetical protein
MARTPRWLGLLLLVAAPVALRGEFLGIELTRVPVQRLISNLERRVQKAPDDLEARLNLGRAYSMAAALKVAHATVVVKRATPDVPEGLTGDLGIWVPPENQRSAGPREDAAAEASFRRAIAAFDEVLRRSPDNLDAQLGLGWCLPMIGEPDRARSVLRSLIEAAWAREREASLFDSERTYTVEVAGYLIRLLDPGRDRLEIQTLRQRTQALDANPRRITPIIVPLEARPLEDLVDPQAHVAFDGDGSGNRLEWSWITPAAAWLVHDDSCHGITSALQLFGRVTFWMFWSDGYHALAALDDNGDGELRDGELTGLALWRDANRNGVSDPGEVGALATFGVVALATAHRHTRESTVTAAVSDAGAVLTSGGTRPTYDIWLKPQPKRRPTN